MGSLRFILAPTVAFGHFGLQGFPASDVAVQSFYVIPGFSMALVLNENMVPARGAVRRAQQGPNL